MTRKISHLILILLSINYVRSDQVADWEKMMDDKLEIFKKQLEQLNKTVESNKNLITQDHINNELSCGKDWITFSDTKCYKVLGKKGSEMEAKGNCTQLESSSTLITIQSKEENDFLSNRLKDYKNISDNVWIGLEFINKSFKWMDGKELKFENWGENSIKDGNSKCVQMSLADSELGKWTDDLCQKKYLFVCQKKQLTKTVLKEELKNLTMVVDKQQDQINRLIPLGFLYTQLPIQSSPQQLWPNMEWTEVTQQYSGLFFRAEGGGSEPFGKVQQANQSWISNIVASTYYYADTHERHFGTYEITKKAWTTIQPGNALDSLTIYLTDSEVRPQNTAIKIWKRIK